MKSNLKVLASMVLASALVASAQTAKSGVEGSAATRKTTHKAKPVRKPAKPSVESQIESLRQDMETQIQMLKQQLADRDAQLQQAQQTAAAAQQAAQQAEQGNQMQQQAAAQTAASVNSLQNAVGDLKTTTKTQVLAVQTSQAKIEKSIESPDAVRFKGVTLSPTGSFLAGETVYRSKATGGGLNTPFGAIPLPGQPQANYSEFYGTGRQSRIALLAQGKLDNMTIGGYYEADFLSAAATSNNNQSNSYSLRQRQMWAQAALKSGWTFTGGQMWSLATETTKGLQNRSEILPSTIDPQYAVGFVWTRQYAFRITKDFGRKIFFGVSAENPQIASVAGHNFPSNLIVGQAGNGGGLFNPLANYASNAAPDFIAKVAFEPGWGHYELFGISRVFRARVYPNDLSSVAANNNSTGAYNDDAVGGGIGGGFRVPSFHKRLDIGAKGLWGDGIGRYGSTGLPDTTVDPGGQLALLHGFSALGTLEAMPTTRLNIYANYGTDYAFKRYFMNSAGKEIGYGAPTFVNTGCDKEPLPGAGGYAPGGLANCTADTKDLQEFILGYWYDFYKGPKGRLRQGLQYSYFQRFTYPGVGGAPKGTDNGFWTSFRYYLP
ncbi:MAG: hypothetical protein HIU93_07245 [Acidobacteria bacterium]|nr:hypothetical protein [Acidobacteriota bacterium]MBW4045762.1 hypothetical protein [Acidobacteriota bacterium]